MATAGWRAQALWLVGRLQPLTQGFSMALGLVAQQRSVPSFNLTQTLL